MLNPNYLIDISQYKVIIHKKLFVTLYFKLHNL